jgi:hypothetical protein
MMMMTVHDMPQQQHQRNLALARANKVRTARKVMREQAKAGELDVCEVLMDPPATIDTARIDDVVMWAPGIGGWRTKRILSGLARSDAKVSHLGQATRSRIVERLRASLDGAAWDAA